jgi:hypothetical protein
MGLLRKISDSDIQGEKVQFVHPTIGATIAAMTTATEPDGSRTKKKRKRNEPTLTASATDAAFNEISDDSDASSDEEKSLQESPLGGLNRRLEFGTKKRRKHLTGRRRVVFGDAESTTSYHPATLTKAELRVLKRDLWFTKQDRLRSQAECLVVLKAFRIQNAEDVTLFSTVYRTSMQVPFSQESSDYLERATVSVPLTIRGLEWGIAPKLKKRRKEHIQSILALQELIRDVDLRERFVSSRSLQSSRPARIMARMIGEGDASASKMGTTSTALNVTTVPMAKTTTKKKTATEKLLLGTQLPHREQHQQHNQHNLRRNNKERNNDTNNTSCGVATTTRKKKLGHARRPRRAILWRK